MRVNERSRRLFFKIFFIARKSLQKKERIDRLARRINF
jgi:hypothetical protein